MRNGLPRILGDGFWTAMEQRRVWRGTLSMLGWRVGEVLHAGHVSASASVRGAGTMMRWLLVLLALACVESHAQPTMAGTPTSITWGSGATPAGQPVTVTGDACYFTWTHYAGSGDGTASVTLGGNSPDTFFEIVRDQFESDGAATGVAAWYAGAGLPSAGTQTLVPVWDGS